MITSRKRLQISRFLAFASLTLLAGAAQAIILPITFDVEVQARYTHDGTGGFSDLGGSSDENWNIDSSYTGQQFSLDFMLDLQDSPQNLPQTPPAVFAQAPLSAVPSSPLREEVMSSYTMLPFFAPFPYEPSSSVSFSERSPDTGDSGFTTFADSVSSLNNSNPFASTAASTYRMVLQYAYSDLSFLPLEPSSGDIVLTEEELQNHLMSLFQNNASFRFAEFAATYSGGSGSFIRNTASATGLRYTGVARIASIGETASVPLPATLSMMFLGMFTLLGMRLRRTKLGTE